MVDKKYNECSLLISLLVVLLWFGNMQCQTCHKHTIYGYHKWQDNTSEMFINIPFIFAGSKILQLHKYF